MPQIAFERMVQRPIVRPLAGGLVEGDGTQVRGDEGNAIGGEQGERLPLDCREGRRVRNRLVDEQLQDLASRVEVGAGIGHGLLRRQLGRSLRLLLIPVDEVDERIDETVVNLAEAMVGETEQVEAGGRSRHAPQLVDRVELDQRGVVFHALRGEPGGR